jgi:hypothetical protein
MYAQIINFCGNSTIASFREIILFVMRPNIPYLFCFPMCSKSPLPQMSAEIEGETLGWDW